MAAEIVSIRRGGAAPSPPPAELAEMADLTAEVKALAKRLVRLKMVEDAGKKYLLTGDGTKVAILLNALALEKAGRVGAEIHTPEELQNFLVNMEEG